MLLIVVDQHYRFNTYEMDLFCFQILPFLALGLGVDDMFLIAHTYAENANNEYISYKVN